MRLLLLFYFLFDLINVAFAARRIPDQHKGADTYDIMASVIHDQLGSRTPIREGKNYAFAEYWPGNKIEDICNGGAHAVMIVGQFSTAKDSRGKLFKWFDASAWDLDPALDAHFKHGLRAEHRKRKWTPYKTMEKGGRLDALGIVRQDLDDEQIIDLIEKKSFDYFGKYREYSTLRNNCGQYVNYLMKVLKVEFLAYGDLPGEKRPN